MNDFMMVINDLQKYKLRNVVLLKIRNSASCNFGEQESCESFLLKKCTIAINHRKRNEILLMILLSINAAEVKYQLDTDYLQTVIRSFKSFFQLHILLLSI